MNVIELACVAIFAAAAFTGVVAVGTLPRDGEEMIVFAAPGTPAGVPALIVARAEGELVALTGLDWAVIARSDQAGFSGKLYDSGAAFVAGSAIAALCAPGRYQGRR